MLSDTEGVDFGGYLQALVRRVRTSWYELAPAEARFPQMKQGKVSVQFAILRDGTASALQYAVSSGDLALDRAAYNSIVRSSPFLALPSNFEGHYLELRLTFLYNPQFDPKHNDAVVSVKSLGANLNNPTSPFPREATRPGSPHVTTSMIPSHWAPLPEAISTPLPSYPQKAIRAGVQGSVLISGVVTKKGKVSHATVSGTAEPRLDQAALKAVKNWAFQPPGTDGQVADVPFSVQVTFSLK